MLNTIQVTLCKQQQAFGLHPRGTYDFFDALVALNFLKRDGDAFDYTGADFRKWCGDIGFQRFEIIGLTGPAIAYK